jgi:hypothetical protein
MKSSKDYNPRHGTKGLGWYPFGTAVACECSVQFSEEQDEMLVPIYEKHELKCNLLYNEEYINASYDWFPNPKYSNLRERLYNFIEFKALEIGIFEEDTSKVLDVLLNKGSEYPTSLLKKISRATQFSELPTKEEVDSALIIILDKQIKTELDCSKEYKNHTSNGWLK